MIILSCMILQLNVSWLFQSALKMLWTQIARGLLHMVTSWLGVNHFNVQAGWDMFIARYWERDQSVMKGEVKGQRLARHFGLLHKSVDMHCICDCGPNWCVVQNAWDTSVWEKQSAMWLYSVSCMLEALQKRPLAKGSLASCGWWHKLWLKETMFLGILYVPSNKHSCPQANQVIT